ncbi:MAG: aminoacetone oxidase family FAD-binding enzyme [Lachnospiraceae bacterium]|nr:aminoacetone oxidase family FAD-binding enzyme [Lachnospiraceae bacterium]
MKKKHKLIIVGGGASGMLAAIVAARQGIDTALLEANELPGKKILATGNGKCNFTNRVQREDCYRGEQPEVAMQLLVRYPVERILEFFTELGIVPKERNGYYYPYSEQAASVREALELTLSALPVTIYTNCHAEAVQKEKNGFRIQAQQRMLLSADGFSKGNAKNGKKASKPAKPVFSEPFPVEFSAEYLILATGGQAGNIKGADGSGYMLAAALGHQVITPVPALVQLKAANPECAELAGVRQEAAATLRVGEKHYQEQGEFLFTEYGISGIPILQLSRYAACALLRKEKVQNVKLYLDFFPQTTENSLQKQIEARFLNFPERTNLQKLTGLLPSKLNAVLLKRVGMRSEAKETLQTEQGQKIAKRLVTELKHFELEITGTNSFENAQVTAGGVPLAELAAETMESRRCEHLYIIGELADIDGTCGGYNLQWAWMSAFAAADAIVAASKVAQNREARIGEHRDKSKSAEITHNAYR